MSLSEPLLRTSSSLLRSAQVGDEFVVSTDAVNNGSDAAALLIVEVRDSDGITVLLDWQSWIARAGSSVQAGVLWVPDKAGDYELRTFAISDSDIPVILSPVGKSEITIASSPGIYPLLVGDETFDVRYQFSSAEGTLQGMQFDLAQLAITADVRVARATNLELALPVKMLEQLETVSGSHYCVGNEFIVFVNGAEVLVVDVDADTARILTIPVSQGSNRVDIIGTDLLIAPPNCVTLGTQYLFVKDLSVEVKTWSDAVVIARDHLDNLAQQGGEEAGTYRGGPLGSVELVYVHGNGTAFVVNRYDGLLEEQVPYFELATQRSNYFWIVTLNYAQDIETAEYTFTIDAQTRQVRGLTVS